MLPADKDILDKSQRLDRALSRSPGSSMHGALNFMDHLNRSRRAGQAGARQQQDQSTSFDLTGRTGSYMYMAPEVLMGQPYNEKVGSLQGSCPSRGSSMGMAPKVPMGQPERATPQNLCRSGTCLACTYSSCILHLPPPCDLSGAAAVCSRAEAEVQQCCKAGVHLWGQWIGWQLHCKWFKYGEGDALCRDVVL